jgi:hypothetical protein
MNGLQSLMQGAPTQPTQQPQLQQPQQAPATLDQNDPRMAAAMNVVENDVPEPLKEFVDKNDFAQKAIALLQSAGGQAAMDQTPAKPPTIKQRVDQQAMEGVAGLLQRLAPGMQQRGQQAQRQQARQMMGGLPTQPAPNMRFAASGGLIGYNEGGDIMGPPEPNLYQRMGQGLKNYGANAQESMGILKAVKAGIGVPYEERSAVMKQVRDEIAAQNQNRDPNFIERMGQKLMNAGLNVEESKAILKKFYDTFGKTYEEMSNGRAMGGQIKGYAGPDGSDVELDEDLIASLMAQQPKATGYTGFSAAERRSQLEREEAVTRANKANANAEYNLKARLASQYPELTREALDQYVKAQNAKRLDAVSNLEGLGSLRAKPFRMQGTDKNETPEFRMQGVGTARPTETEFMPEGSSVTGGAGNIRLSEAEKPVSEATAYDYMSDPNLYAPTQAEEPDADILRRAMEQMNRDPEAEAIAAGERLRGLIGADKLMAQRAEKQAALDAQREAMFSPEETRRRRIKAGLAGLAERGLGGFGAGDTAERDKISAERIASSEASVANMDKLIGELRELGMSQFEAEKQAREMVQKATEQGASTSQAIVASRRRAQDAAAQNETTRRGQDMQAATSMAVAKIQTSNSQFGRSLGIRIEELRRNNPELSQTERESRALKATIDDELRVGLARVGVSQEEQNRREINDSIEAATKIITANMINNPMAGAELQTEIFKLAKKIRSDFYGSAASTRTNAPAVGTISGGYRFKGGDPNDQNNWEKI